MSEKKRKRADEPTAQKKQKKAAIVEPRSSSVAPTIKVSSLLRQTLTPPVIATAPGLSLPATVKFDSYAKVQTLRNRKITRTELKGLLLHSTSHKSIDYTAREDKLKQADGILRHYIGVFDAKTGELQVVEARKVTVRGSVRSQQASAEAMGAFNEKQANMEMRAELGQTFGTKKAKKALFDRVENAVTAEAIRGEMSISAHKAGENALMESLQSATASMPSREELQEAVDGAKPVPKGNYGASEIQDVYDVEEIIGGDVLYSIPVRDWQESIKNGTAIHVLSRYVANRVRRVGEGPESVKRLRILRYLYFLVIFWIKARVGKGRAKRALHKDKLKTELAPAPDIVIESLRKKFTDHGDIRKSHTDLLMTTCCVLASFLDSFEVDTFDLREDLRLEQKQMNQYFHEIGARTKTIKSAEGAVNMAKLSLPLEFPKMRMQRRK